VHYVSYEVCSRTIVLFLFPTHILTNHALCYYSHFVVKLLQSLLHNVLLGMCINAAEHKPFVHLLCFIICGLKVVQTDINDKINLESWETVKSLPFYLYGSLLSHIMNTVMPFDHISCQCLCMIHFRATYIRSPLY